MGEPNWENRTLFHHDNLAVLRGMNSESVDLIATDPPFNKSKDFHATPDSLATGASFQDRWRWQEDVMPEWLDQLQDDHPGVWAVIDWSRLTYGDDMGAFLCFMAVRLLEMRRVLKPTGAIYLQCDRTACHYLKALMDAVFGRHEFRDAITWRRNESGAKGSQHAPKTWGNNWDSLLYYVKGKKATFDPLIHKFLNDKEIMAKFPKVDESGERYNTKTTAWCSPSMGPRPNLCYEFHGFRPPYPAGWRLASDRMQEEYEKGNIVILENKVERRSYLKDYAGVSPGNLWTETELLLGAQSNERYGYPTQKPLALYDRIIQASSAPGDIVLDPFCGCATTPIAAERCGWRPERSDADQQLEPRQWVGIDIWDGAHKAILDRMETVGMFTADARGWKLSSGDIHYRKRPPRRSDDGKTAAPFLRVKVQVQEPAGPRMSRKAMYRFLLEQNGPICQGCDREFDDPRYLELDHNTPRSDGGINHISNRVLLCAPCNRLKSNTSTLSGLREKNEQSGYMAGSDGEHPLLREIRERREGDLFWFDSAASFGRPSAVQDEKAK